MRCSWREVGQLLHSSLAAPVEYSSVSSSLFRVAKSLASLTINTAAGGASANATNRRAPVSGSIAGSTGAGVGVIIPGSVGVGVVGSTGPGVGLVTPGSVGVGVVGSGILPVVSPGAPMVGAPPLPGVICGAVPWSAQLAGGLTELQSGSLPLVGRLLLLEQAAKPTIANPVSGGMSLFIIFIGFIIFIILGIV